MLSAATFIRADTTTQGNWGAVYGADGHQLFDGTNLPSSVTSYATVTPANQLQATWASSTSDVRGMETQPWFDNVTQVTREAAC